MDGRALTSWDREWGWPSGAERVRTGSAQSKSFSVEKLIHINSLAQLGRSRYRRKVVPEIFVMALGPQLILSYLISVGAGPDKPPCNEAPRGLR